MIDGKMQDDATWKQSKVMVNLAEMLAARDPELAELYGMNGHGGAAVSETDLDPARDWRSGRVALRLEWVGGEPWMASC